MPYFPPSESEEEVEQGEVDAAEEHGSGEDVLLHGCEGGNAIGVDGETTGGDVGEGEVYSIPCLHSCCQKGEDEEDGERKVDSEGASHGDDGTHKCTSCIVGSRGFSGIEGVFVDAQFGREGENEEDDAKTTKPLHHRAPKEYRRGQRGDIGEDGGSTGGETRHGFEPCSR